eukprot:6197269-Pleurochrysis_carterae.AAC.4
MDELQAAGLKPWVVYDMCARARERARLFTLLCLHSLFPLHFPVAQYNGYCCSIQASQSALFLNIASILSRRSFKPHSAPYSVLERDLEGILEGSKMRASKIYIYRPGEHMNVLSTHLNSQATFK